MTIRSRVLAGAAGIALVLAGLAGTGASPAAAAAPPAAAVPLAGTVVDLGFGVPAREAPVAPAYAVANVASPFLGAITTYTRGASCTPVQDSHYEFDTVAEWGKDSSNNTYSLRWTDSYWFKNSAPLNWGAAYLTRDQQGSWQGTQWQGDPPSSEMIVTFNGPYRTGGLTHVAHQTTSGSPGGKFVSCGTDIFAQP